MCIKDDPHYELSTDELARWLDLQGDDRWWNVDGEYFEGSGLDLPCPSDELAAVLRRRHQTLLLADKDENPEARGQTVRAEDLDRLAERMTHWSGEGDVTDRVFHFCWKGDDNIWLLAEDGETSTSEARHALKRKEIS
jgi:hypothetical protein